eukprot:TRINITY_DN881_c0_g1_i10.p1 TRINITY_DN881_c0_g1~~TRINITY_DN881_c0_g1_i10.p1  ORF type:complete len:540 (+),score=203.77 TRINITY_DN881_c0_g1_i10:88-1707(+)
MADMADNQGPSKSAKRRAAKKARDAAHEEAAEAAAPPAAPAPKATPKAKAKAAVEPSPAASQPKSKAKAKAAAEPPPAEPKGKAKAKAKAEAAPAAAQPGAKAKSSAKAKAQPKAAPEPEPKKGAKKAEPKATPPPEPKQEAKSKAQPKASTAKAKAQPVKVEEEKQTAKVEIVQPFEIDDGSMGGWEVTTGVSKKQQKRQEKAAYAKEAQGGMPANQKAIPGMAPPGQHIPGMAPVKTSQADINAVLAGAAAAGVAARKAAEAEMNAEKEKESNQSTATIKVPEKKIGIVIGPKGSKIKLIQEKTGAKIDTSGEVFTIIGEPQAVSLAEAAIRELVEKGYCSMAFENFKEEFVQVHPSCFPDLIGKQGATIKALKTELGVEVNMPDVPKAAPGKETAKKYKVTLAGKKENVETCKEVINHICLYGYHEITHPDQSHEVLEEVPQWAYSFLIGKAGSELKHIQNNYKVKVNIPREHSACQSVVVVGLKHDVERAKGYIEKLLWNAENQSKGRDRQDGATDHWGDEEAEEDWMKAYLYKR